MSELKPCPFCGGEATTMEIQYEGWTAMCVDCPAETSYLFTEEEAIEAWNRRVSE